MGETAVRPLPAPAGARQDDPLWSRPGARGDAERYRERSAPPIGQKLSPFVHAHCSGVPNGSRIGSPVAGSTSSQ